MTDRNNQNFKRLVFALSLTKADIHDILGGQVSKSKIDTWLRNASARKNATGTSQAETVSRYRPMSDDHFDQFCEGLVSWLRQYREDRE